MSTQTPEPDCVIATLRWCNEKRAEQGKGSLDRLPKGRLGDPLSCPCGKATGLHVWTHFWASEAFMDVGSLPLAVVEFVALFDGGSLPQYEES